MLFAPMDRSVASSVTTAVCTRCSHRRRVQGLWLGLSPVVTVAIVALLYLGGTVSTRLPSLSALNSVSKGALPAPNQESRVTDTAVTDSFLAPPAHSEGVQSLGAMCQEPSFCIILEGDSSRRQLLVTWLRARHADVSVALETAMPGSEVILMLGPDEIHGFAVLMALHGFTGQGLSGLTTVARFSFESWESILNASSSICLVP